MQRYEGRVAFKSTVFMLYSMNRGMKVFRMAFPAPYQRGFKPKSVRLKYLSNSRYIAL